MYKRNELLVLDGMDNVYVFDHFPEGSTTHAFPHVVVQREPVLQPRGYAPERFAVHISRVSAPGGEHDGGYPFSDCELASLMSCS